MENKQEDIIYVFQPYKPTYLPSAIEIFIFSYQYSLLGRIYFHIYPGAWKCHIIITKGQIMSWVGVKERRVGSQHWNSK